MISFIDIVNELSSKGYTFIDEASFEDYKVISDRVTTNNNFVATGAKSITFNNLVFNEKRANMSVRVAINGYVIVDGSLKDLFGTDKIETVKYRTFTIIKDGKYNLDKLILYTDREGYFFLYDNNIKGKNIGEGVYEVELDLNQIPVADEKGLDFSFNNMYYEIININVKKGSRKILKYLLDEIGEEGSVYSAYKEELAKYGLNTNLEFVGTQEYITKQKEMAPVLEFNIKGGVPSVKALFDKVEKGKSLNVVEKNMLKDFDIYKEKSKVELERELSIVNGDLYRSEKIVGLERIKRIATGYLWEGLSQKNETTFEYEGEYGTVVIKSGLEFV